MHISLWHEIITLISQSIDAHRFNTWIRPLIPVETDNSDVLVLSAPNRFTLDFLEQHYKNKILTYAQKVAPSVKAINFVINQEDASSPVLSEPPLQDIPSSVPKKRRMQMLNNQYTFDLFVAGSGNEFAKSVSLAVAENPGKTKFNPLLIYGGVGLGKTHLLHAIGNHILHHQPNFIVNFVTSEEFYFNFIEAIKNSTTKLYADKFRESDILLVDDVQFFSGKERTQEEFFYIFNTLYQQGKQIVLTSDLPPNDLKGLHDRLVSRFQWGLCVDIQPPDLETRVAILKKKAERDHLNIPEDIIYFIAEHISTNVRKLEGVIIRLLAFASITKTDITIDLVKNILRDSIKKEHSKISIDDIIDTVSEYYHIPVNNLREKNRSKEVAHCRQVAMYIAKIYTNYSLKTIGLHFGGRDHSTVIHAVKQIDQNKEKDKILTTDINYILSQLGN